MPVIQDVDVVVVGAGVLGLAVTDALVTAGVSTVCLEMGEPGGRQSSGATRIFRHSYKSLDVIRFAQTSMTGWNSWSARLGEPLVAATGSLLITDDPDDVQGLVDTGVEFELLTRDRQAEMLPWRTPSKDAAVVLETGAGTIRARETIAALVGWVGPALRRELVLDVTPLDGGGAVVRTAGHVLRAGAVVVCAGADLPRFAAELALDVSFASHPHTRGVFRVRDRSRDALASPSFRDKTAHPTGAIYSYSIPVSESEVAVGIEPSDNAATFDPIRIMTDTVDWVSSSLPGLDPEPVRLQSCDSTALKGGGALPWESEGMGIWRRGDVFVFAGGHYFKFAPALGEILAKVALGAPIPDLLTPRPAGA